MMQMLLSRCKCIFLCKCFLFRCKCEFLDIWCKCSLQICKMSIPASWCKCSSLKMQMANFYFMVQMLFSKMQMWISIPWFKCFLFHDANAFYRDVNANFYSMMQMLFKNAYTDLLLWCKCLQMRISNVFFFKSSSLMPQIKTLNNWTYFFMDHLLFW